MGNEVSKVLRNQYLKLCSLKVDEVHQVTIQNSLDNKLQQVEKRFADNLEPDGNLLQSYSRPLLKICLEDDQQLEALLAPGLGEYPKLKLTSDLVEFLFLQVNNSSSIPELLKLLINTLKPSLFRLALGNHKSLIEDSNPIIQAIETLINYVPLWKDEDKVNYPTFKKLTSLLNFAEVDQKELQEKLQQQVAQVQQILENQQKRSLIFEKRLVEREASLVVTNNSDRFIEKLVEDLKQAYQLDSLLVEFIDQYWVKLLKLEFIRQDYVAFMKALELILRLFFSLKELNNQRELNLLVDGLPIIKQGLIDGLDKIAVSEIEANEFLNKVEQQHLEIIQKQTLNRENETLDSDSDSEQSTNEDSSEQSSKNTTQPAPKIDEDDLIRLKPNDFYSDDSSLPKNQQALEPQQEEDNSLTIDEEPLVENEIATTLQVLEQLEIIVRKGEQSTALDEQQAKRFFEVINADLAQSIYSSVEGYANNTIEEYMTLNQWYSFEQQSNFHKLIFIEPNSKLHVFVNQLAQKSHSYDVATINQLYEQHAITKYVVPNLVEPALKKALQRYRDFLSARKQRKIEVTESANDLTMGPNDLTQQSPIEKTQQATEQQGSTGDSVSTATQPSIGLESITVGTWIVYELNNHQIKCKLAARIVSKDVYIFVDRKGLKILEQSSAELQQKLESQKITLLEADTSSPARLESVIAKTRNLKSEA